MPMGGMHCQCSDFNCCEANQAQLGRFLDVPADLLKSTSRGGGGKDRGKGRGKGGEGKHKHKGTSKGSSWQPR